MTAVDTHLLLRALVDELARCGVRDAVTSPGSRNTPIVEALVAEERLHAWSQLDERSAGFFALGAAKAAGRPVIVTTTSGGAVANLMPAVIEASEAHVPLIVLSADRPAELRQIGAGQTIDQVKLFGTATRFFAELDLDRADAARMRWVRSLACRAYLAAVGDHAGPVHLNVPLREPLVLEQALAEDPPGGGGHEDGGPWVWPSTAPAPAQRTPTAPAVPDSVRAVVVAGQFDTAPNTGRLLAAIARGGSLPLLADPLSHARSGPAAIAHYDLILRDPVSAEALAPELVIQVGELVTSKPLRTWLAGLDGVDHIVLSRHASWPDPGSRMSQLQIVERPEMLRAVRDYAAPPEWLARWRRADAAVSRTIEQILAGGVLTEPTVARTLAERLPASATLVVSASMPIRDVEEFFPVRADPPRVLANRGANGIDGTVSTAFGVAAASPDSEVVLLIGDVALLHDIGGLLSAPRTGLKLTIVLVNNDGGGIFHFLAIADEAHAKAFAEHVATPHGRDFAHAAALYGLEYVVPSDVSGLQSALDTALEGEASTLIEVRTNRGANRALHRNIERAARAALARAA